MPGEHPELGQTMSRLPKGQRCATINLQLDYDLWSQAERQAWHDGERTMDWIEGAIRSRLASADITDPRGNAAAGNRKP